MSVFDTGLIQSRAMANASLNGVPLRLNPDSVQLSFSTKTTTIPTLGGLVVQVFGIEYSDLVVTGSFGVGGHAAQQTFLSQIQGIAYAQSTNFGETLVSNPVKFLFPLLGYDFDVHVKAFTSPQGQSIVYDNTIVNLQYTLTLFIDDDYSPLATQQVAADGYLTGLASGLGWTNKDINTFNGPTSSAEAQALITTYGGTLADLTNQFFGGPGPLTAAATAAATGTGGTTSTTTSPGSATSAPTLSGSGNSAQIWNYLTKTGGLTAVAAAGVMGNFQSESGFDPAVIQGGAIAPATYQMVNGVGFGIAQWTYTSRQAPLAALAKQMGSNITDLAVQLAYVMQELNGAYASTKASIQADTTPSQAAVDFGLGYEGYAGGIQQARSTQAETIFTQYS